MKQAIKELIEKCSVDLPRDIEEAVRESLNQEEEGSPGYQCITTIIENISRARKQRVPMCQDTGVPVFHVSVPDGWPVSGLLRDIREAVAESTESGILRPNCVATLSGENTGTNTGSDMPFIHMRVWERDDIRIRLLLKGGGSENASGQYKLPHSKLQAERDLEGVRKIVLHHVTSVQGRGCPPGIIGVGIGGDRENSYRMAKKQLFRILDDTNENSELRRWEERVLADINRLGIGPMGLGGNTTALSVKAGVCERHPACYFVTVSYLCWAGRRHEITLEPEEIQN